MESYEPVSGKLVGFALFLMSGKKHRCPDVPSGCSDGPGRVGQRNRDHSALEKASQNLSRWLGEVFALPALGPQFKLQDPSHFPHKPCLKSQSIGGRDTPTLVSQPPRLPK